MSAKQGKKDAIINGSMSGRQRKKDAIVIGYNFLQFQVVLQF